MQHKKRMLILANRASDATPVAKQAKPSTADVIIFKDAPKPPASDVTPVAKQAEPSTADVNVPKDAPMSNDASDVTPSKQTITDDVRKCNTQSGCCGHPLKNICLTDVDATIHILSTHNFGLQSISIGEKTNVMFVLKASAFQSKTKTTRQIWDDCGGTSLAITRRTTFARILPPKQPFTSERKDSAVALWRISK